MELDEAAVFQSRIVSIEAGRELESNQCAYCLNGITDGVNMDLISTANYHLNDRRG